MAEETKTAEVQEREIPFDRDSEFLENMTRLIRAEQRAMVMNVVMDLHEADVARLLPHLSDEDAYTLFHWLPAELAGEVVADLDDEYRRNLLEDQSSRRLTAIIDVLDTDDAADVLGNLPDRVVQNILPRLGDAVEVKELLQYEEETAGGLMSAEFVAVRQDQTVAETTEEVRKKAEKIEQVYTVYVVDNEGELEGMLPLKRLLLAPSSASVVDIMERGVVTVSADVDQEEVVRIMERYDLVALPVVDESGHLLGRITIDDVVDVLREEAEEDIQRMSGIVGDEEPTASVFRISRGRLVWLFLGLIGAMLSAMVIISFESKIQELVVLAMFIPVVTAMAGNVGIQSSAIAVQGLASGDIWDTDLPKRLAKELFVSLLNGVVLAIVLSFIVFFLQRTDIIRAPDVTTYQLSTAVGLSLFTVMVLAATIGATTPLVLNRLKIDPALATGPFITTLNDIIGLVIYFLIASAIVL